MNEHNYSSISGWKIVGIIGRGNFGTVYEISRELPDCQEYAALKVITIPKEEDLEDLQQNYGQDSLTKTFNKQMQDTFKEYSLMHELSGNTNIVNVHDVEVVQHDNGIGWNILIRMELLTPLTQLVKEKELPEAQIVKLGKDLCRALALCGKSSIVHRDIKPQNIFASVHGDYKLGDFGIAKISERTSSGTKAGTPRFMAPEVNNDEKYGGRADIYSLGLVMYWLLNDKRLPFMPKSGTLDDDEIARKRRLNGENIPEPAHGSERLKTIVCKACAFHPEDRFSDAREMLDALETINVSEEPIVIPPPVVKPLPPHEFVPFGGTTNNRTSTNDVSNRDVVKEQDTKLKGSDETSSDGDRRTGTRRGRKTQEEIEKEKEDKERKKREEEQERERKEKEEKRKRLILFGSAGAVLLIIILLIAFLSGSKPEPSSSTTFTPAAPSTASYKWSEWSDWSTNAVSESSTREVETRQNKTLIGYNMVHYGTQQEQEPHYRMFRDYSIEGNYEKYGARSSYPEKHLTKTVTVSQMNKATTYPANGERVTLFYNGGSYGGYQMGTTTAYNFGDDYYIWFIESEDYSVVTEYRHRDLIQVP